MRPAVLAVLAVLVAVGATISGPPPVPAAAQPIDAASPVYLPPVDGVVIDPFRAPSQPFGPGNRGIDYATVPGSPVRASAPGRVSFAGVVAGALHVTVEHADGLRTTYSFLASVAVSAGAHVDMGSVVGTSGATLHFGVRRGATYLDPESVLAPPAERVHLVADDSPTPDGGRRARPGPVTAAAVTWATNPRADGASGCTRRDVQPPAPAARRIVVLVGGLGSSSDQAAVDAVDTAALGYEAGDVLRFSYRGGRVPTARPSSPDLAGLDAFGYGAADTVGDLRIAGGRLATLLAAVTRAAPGTTIDVIAHSQGGIVAMAALAALGDAADERTLEAVDVVATLGTPHQGVDLAAAVRLVQLAAAGDELLAALAATTGMPFDADDQAVAQLAPGSALLAELAARRPPPAVRTVSIGARGDLVVAAHRTNLEGGRNVVVSIEGLVGDHEALPASPAVTREVALALVGLPPSCGGRLDRFADAVAGPAIGMLEQIMGAIVAVTSFGLAPTAAPG